MFLQPTCPPSPPRIYRSQGSGFRPDIPRASLNRHTQGSPGGSPEVLGCSVGTSGSRARRANPHPHPSPSQAAAKLPFVSHCSRLLQSHGHVALPARGVPGSTPGPGDAPALGQPVGCWLPANPEPLIPAGPRACQAAQLRVADPLASTLPGAQLLCSAFSSFTSGTVSWALPTPIF